MTLNVFIDGGAINNPGPAACAFVVYSEKKIVFSFAEKIGVATNNVAEYTALIMALGWIRENKRRDATDVIVNSDSRLLVNQVNGLFKVKKPSLREFILKIRILEGEIGIPVSYKNIPREKNALADSLVKKAFYS